MRLGTGELLLIFALAIVLFGTNKVAGMGKALGTSIREFKTELNKVEKEVKVTGDDEAK